MSTKERIIKKIIAGKCAKNEESASYFYDAARDYIKAVKDGRMLCVIESVSQSGMSRVMKFHSCEKNGYGYYYRQYWNFFKSMGYSQAKNSDGFRVAGCGMDMVFATNYNIIHKLASLGFLNKKQCSELSQKTPTVL